MALYPGLSVIAVAQETTSGTEVVPAGTDALVVSDLSVEPLDSDTVQYLPIQPYFGAAEEFVVATQVKVSFGMYLSGSGSASVMPPYKSLLRACNLYKSDYQNATAITGISYGTTVGSLKPATATVTGHGFHNGTQVTIAGCTPSGANATNAIVFNVTANTFDYWVPAATGAVTVLGTVSADQQWLPHSTRGADQVSLTMHYYLDGALHRIVWAKGSATFTLKAKSLPMMQYEFTGLLAPTGDYIAVDQTLAGVDFSAFKKPVPCSTTNTTGIALHTTTNPVLHSVEFKVANDVVHRQPINAESVEISDRLITSNITIETPGTADLATLIGNARTAAAGAFAVSHGPALNGIKLRAPSMQLFKPKYGEVDKVSTLSFEGRCLKITGDDEFALHIY